MALIVFIFPLTNLKVERKNMRRGRLFCPECVRHGTLGEEKNIYFDEGYLKALNRTPRNPWVLTKSAFLCNFCQCTIPAGLAERRGITNEGRLRLMPHEEVIDMWHDEYVAFGIKKLW